MFAVKIFTYSHYFIFSNLRIIDKSQYNAVFLKFQNHQGISTVGN